MGPAFLPKMCGPHCKIASLGTSLTPCNKQLSIGPVN